MMILNLKAGYTPLIGIGILLRSLPLYFFRSSTCLPTNVTSLGVYILSSKVSVKSDFMRQYILGLSQVSRKTILHYVQV